MAGVPATIVDIRRKAMLDALPDAGYVWKTAAVMAGYSPKYAETSLVPRLRKDKKFCEAVLEKRRQIEAQTQDLRTKCLKRLEKIVDDERTPNTTAIRAIDTLSRICGWISQTTVIETPARQRELTDARREELRRLALLRFDTSRPLLQAPTIEEIKAMEAEPVDAQQENEPAQPEEEGDDPPSEAA